MRPIHPRHKSAHDRKAVKVDICIYTHAHTHTHIYINVNWCKALPKVCWWIGLVSSVLAGWLPWFAWVGSCPWKRDSTIYQLQLASRYLIFSWNMCFTLVGPNFPHCRRKFRSQTSDNMDRWKVEMGRVTEKRRVEERRSEKRKSQKKEDADARKGRKVAIHCVFPMICGSGGSKSRLAEAAGAEPSGQMRDEKIARRCGAKHISKWKCTKHTILGPLLEVEMSKKCTPLWREAHFEVKMFKPLGDRTTFGGSDVASLHYTTLHYTTLQHITLHYTTLQYTTLHYTTLQVHSSTLNYTTPHYITLHHAPLHYTTLHHTTLHHITLHYTTLHYTTLH